MVCVGLVWLRIGTMEGSCEHGNEPSGSIKCCTIGGFSRRAQLHEWWWLFYRIFLFLHLCIYVSIYLSILCLFISLLIYLYVYLLFIYLCICMFVYSSIYLSASLFSCHSIHRASIHLSLSVRFSLSLSIFSFMLPYVLLSFILCMSGFYDREKNLSRDFDGFIGFQPSWIRNIGFGNVFTYACMPL
jgi:hypothetical protein